MNILYAQVGMARRYMIWFVDGIVIIPLAGIGIKLFEGLLGPENNNLNGLLGFWVGGAINFWLLPHFFQKTVGSAMFNCLCGSVDLEDGILKINSIRNAIKAALTPLLLLSGFTFFFRIVVDFKGFIADFKGMVSRYREQSEEIRKAGYIPGYTLLYDRWLDISYFRKMTEEEQKRLAETING